MSRPLRVLLVAAEGAGAQVLRVIERGGFELAGLLVSSGERGERALGSAVSATATRLGCPVWPARSVRDPAFADTVRSAEVDILLNVHSLYVIRGEILVAPRIGSFNMHPGPLPEIAGLNAVSWALYEGRRDHAVTVHWMVPDIDAGAIAYRAGFNIEETDNALTLSAKSVRAGVPLIEQLLVIAAKDPCEIPREAQDLSQRRYYGREVPQGGQLIWSRSAEEIVRFVRACDYLPYASPWGHPKTMLGGLDVAVLKAARTGLRSDVTPGAVGEAAGRGVLVAAGDEWVVVQRVLYEGRGVDARHLIEAGCRGDEPVAHA